MTDIPAHTPHTDIVSGGWIDRRMPGWTRPYLKLARLDRPTGIWLLLLPCWWAIALASPTAATGIGMTVLFTLGAIVMRGGLRSPPPAGSATGQDWPGGAGP